MPRVEFLAPTTLEGVLGALGGEGTFLLGGGTSLALLMKTGMVEATRVVWLGKVEALRAITAADGVLRIGAGVTLHSIANSPLVRRHCPSLAAAAGLAANIRVRAVATLGGHLVHADPRQDCPPPLLAAGATVMLASSAGGRVLPLERFLFSLMETAIRPGEVLTQVDVPIDGGRREAYVRFAPASRDDFPTASAAAAVVLDGAGRLARLRVAVGAAGPRPTLHAPPEELWEGRVPDEAVRDAVAGAVAGEVDPVGDHRASAPYRRHVTGVVVGRALVRAWAAAPRAPGGRAGSAATQAAGRPGVT